MAAVLWILLPVFVAGGAALLTFYVMQARQEVALAHEREALSEARVMLSTHQRTLQETIRATEETVRRQALDEFLADVRVEERHYVREHRVLFMNRRSVVLQERLFFRNIPLSNWIEHEILLEEDTDLDRLLKSVRAFGGSREPALAGDTRKLLR
ncbi:MAG: hypothetical protein IT158_03365 [Bryobacterales bacterium]|nr:hypothetical protein [Bryobacterales bacterium]